MPIMCLGSLAYKNKLQMFVNSVPADFTIALVTAIPPGSLKNIYKASEMLSTANS